MEILRCAGDCLHYDRKKYVVLEIVYIVIEILCCARDCLHYNKNKQAECFIVMNTKVHVQWRIQRNAHNAVRTH